MLPILDPDDEHGDHVHGAGARRRHAAERSGPAMPRCRAAGAVGLLGRRERSGTRRVNNHNSMLDKTGPGLARGGGARAEEPGVLQKGSDHPSAKLFPIDAADRHLAVLDPKTKKYTLRRHLLPARTICSSATTPTIRCGPAAAARWSAGSTRRCSTRPATRRSRRAGRRSCSTPTATASATTTSSPTSRSIRRRTSASPRASTP